jgi:hypothetical protein
MSIAGSRIVTLGYFSRGALLADCDDLWVAGPLSREAGEGPTDAAWHSDVLLAPVWKVVAAEEVRRHRALTPQPVEGALGLELDGLEVIDGLPDPDRLLLMLHYSSAADDLRDLTSHVAHVSRRLNAVGRAPLLRQIGRCFGSNEPLTVSDRMSSLVVTSLAAAEPSTPDTDRAQAAWRFFLAAGAVPSTRQLAAWRPDESEPCEVPIPGRKCTVLRDGVAIVHWYPERPEQVVTSQTVALDIVTLGVLQDALVQGVAELVLDEADPIEAGAKLVEAQARLRVLRHRYWWRHCSVWRWPDRLLVALQ